jgi:hypothetical protein
MIVVMDGASQASGDDGRRLVPDPLDLLAGVYAQAVAGVLGAPRRPKSWQSRDVSCTNWFVMQT